MREVIVALTEYTEGHDTTKEIIKVFVDASQKAYRADLQKVSRNMQKKGGGGKDGTNKGMKVKGGVVPLDEEYKQYCATEA